MMADNLSKEIQILAKPAEQKTCPKPPAAWEFKTLDTLRHQVIQRAGRRTRPLRRALSNDECKRGGQERFIALPGCSSKSSLSNFAPITLTFYATLAFELLVDRLLCKHRGLGELYATRQKSPL